MSALFLNILNLAINASWLIVAVIVARRLLKKAPKWIYCLLWGLVAIRLLCPISLESALSLLPSVKIVPENFEMVQDPHVDSGVKIIDNAVNSVIERSFSPDVASSANPMQVVVFVTSIIWLVGAVLMLAYALISFILMKRKVRASAVIRGRVQECDEVDSPFILGVFCPVIYVPSGINEKTLELVIAHEETHLKRHDHWWKPLGFVLLAVYWFNPLCWVAYILFCRDIESACDEKVIRDKDRDYIAAYLQALLDCSTNRRDIIVYQLLFGGISVKTRVKEMVNYKKPTILMIITSIIIVIFVAICFTTNPVSAEEPDINNSALGSVADINQNDGTIIVIRDSNGEVVETHESDDHITNYNESDNYVIDESDDHITNYNEPDNYVIDDSVNNTEYDKLVEIQNEVLIEGIYNTKADYGTVVYAVCDGTVKSAKYEVGYGYCVSIIDDEGREWKYGFCSKLNVEEGGSVHIGDNIALAGHTGYTTEDAIIIRVVE